MATIEDLSKRVAQTWWRLSDCEDEFRFDQAACSGWRDAFDAAVYDLVKVVDPSEHARREAVAKEHIDKLMATCACDDLGAAHYVGAVSPNGACAISGCPCQRFEAAASPGQDGGEREGE